jgi:DUF4097 and DUF4098 domain-containing protein YvlB
MKRASSTIFALLIALSIAAPALAQRNRDRDRDRDRDWDDQRGPTETETFDRTVPLASGGTVRLKTFSGRVTISGTGGSQVVIHAVRRATAERLRDIKIDVRQQGNTVEIDANYRTVERRNDNVVETDFDIQLPAQTNLDLKTFSAPITVTGVRGNMVVDGFSSGIRLTDVSGPVRVKTFSGEVNVEARAWADGDDLNINTFSGGVTVQLPDSARGTIDFDTFSGTFKSDLPVAISSSSRRNFRGTFNGGGSGDFRLKTFSGDVTVKR